MTTMGITDQQHTPSYQTYDVFFHSDTISTTVTDDPDMVSAWIANSDSIYNSRSRTGALIIGLRVEPCHTSSSPLPNPVATLHLSIGRRCLIYQILRSRYIPASLIRLLSDRSVVFVGVGVRKDLEKLEESYGIGGNAAYAIDLGELAAVAYGEESMRRAGLKSLGRVVARKEVQKPKDVVVSRWDEVRLSDEQVKYACLETFVCFEIGRTLNAYF